MYLSHVSSENVIRGQRTQQSSGLFTEAVPQLTLGWLPAYPRVVADPALSTQIDHRQVRRCESLSALRGTARPHCACPAFSPHPRQYALPYSEL